MGFLTLDHYKGKDYAVFFGGQTAQRPKKYDRPEASENAADLRQAALRDGRLAVLALLEGHGPRLDRLVQGSRRSGRELDRWIHNFVSADPNPSEDIERRSRCAKPRSR